ncbi:MAG: HpsJ family protein [Microcoleaceae cyanobacterium MO_207.B10]|nr:HpsJ family protein [Microcoleaceae cyanobacterium MO_207.B10]
MNEPSQVNLNKSVEVNLNKSVEELSKFSKILLKSNSLWHYIGYGLLFFSLLDTITLFIPPQLLNPQWELQTIGSLVERVAVPLIGLALVFYGEGTRRLGWEPPLLKLLSWLSLLLAILFILMIPLGLINTIRLERRLATQINTQLEQGKTQIEQVKQELQQANTPEQMENLLSRLNARGGTPEINSNEQLNEVKQELSSFVTDAETNITTQAQTTKSTRSLNLFRNSIKWNLGALISAVLFIIIWRSTKWAR